MKTARVGARTYHVGEVRFDTTKAIVEIARRCDVDAIVVAGGRSNEPPRLLATMTERRYAARLPSNSKQVTI